MEDESKDYNYPSYQGEEENLVGVRTDSETHIGVEKKSGGWLENETEKILRFAGFKTQRERRIIFEDSTDEHYRIDILAQFEDLTLFVECKDYSELKVNEKILFTLIGQVHDYIRDHPDEVVVGVLVTSAKNLGQNIGIKNKLLREGCQLWDGTTLQQFQDKMIEVDRKSEFTTYLLEKLGYISSPDTSNEKKLLPGQHKFYSRLSFFSIPALQYIGNKFSHTSICNDLRNTLEGTGITLSAISYKKINSVEGDRLSMIVDLEKTLTENKLKEHWNNKSKWFRKPKETPMELMEISFESACKAAIANTYGVEIGHLNDTYPINCIATRSH